MSGTKAGVTRLVVCDSSDDRWIARARAAAHTGDAWHVLVLRVSDRSFQRRHAESLTGLGADVRVLDVGAFASGANREVASFVVDLVWRLPGMQLAGGPLGERLQERERNLWWSLEISEKSSFRGPLIERLYQLALVQRAVSGGAYDEIQVEVRDPELKRAIRLGNGLPPVRPEPPSRTPAMSAARFSVLYWARAALTLLRFLAVRAFIRAHRVPQAVTERQVGIFTIYPYWWTQPYAVEAAERFFSAPPDDAHYVGWLAWPWTLWRNGRAVATTLIRKRILPLQAFIRIPDALRLLSVLRFARLLALRRAVRSLAPIRFGAFDVSRLVAAEITSSMCDAELFFDDLVGHGMSRYATAVAPSTVLYRVEGQPWENAVLGALRSTGTPAVGFFHSAFGENYPALRFARGELGGAGHGPGARPIADAMIVCGSVARDYLIADGYPAGSVALCGPQRHAALVRFLRARPSRRELRDRLKLPHNVPVYFVAIAIVEAETEGLFACLEGALPAEEEFRLLIKTHPNRPLGDESMQAAVRSMGPGRVAEVPAGADMYDCLAASDTMICIGSTLAFEAMALGVMPVVYEHPGTFAVTSLRAFEYALYVVNSPESMKQALAEIAAGAPAAEARRAAFGAAVAGALGDVERPLEHQLTTALEQWSL